MTQSRTHWKPIETAVKDGVPRLLGGKDWVDVGCWVDQLNDASDSGWTCHRVQSWSYEEEAHCHPTHWAELPTPPTGAVDLMPVYGSREVEEK